MDYKYSLFVPYRNAKSPRLNLLWLIFGELRQTSGSTVNSTQFSNSSLNLTSSDVHLNFIRPPINPVTECNLWGPLCQTGTIIVDVNLTTTTTKTTVPCSIYLSAQATSAQRYGWGAVQGEFGYVSPNGYDMSFGRSPECTSYAHHVQNDMPMSLSGCGQNASGTIYSPDKYHGLTDEFLKNLPGGILRYVTLGPMEEAYYCCGSCFMEVDEIRVLYFPDESIRSCSQSYWNNTNKFNTINSITYNSNDYHKRAHSLLGNGSSIAVLDGYTMTSPSLYLQIIGTAKVSDDCGRIGPIRTNGIVPVRSDDLSSLSFNIPIDSTFHYLHETSYLKQVKVADLMCPTWGVKGAFDPAGGMTVGPPFNPIIYPPPNLLHFDPAWSNCDYSHSMERGGLGLPISAIFDPPRILTPVAGLFPTPTPPSAPTQSDSETSAKPADVGHSKLPAITPPPSVVDPDREPPGNAGHGDGAHSVHDKPGPGKNSRPQSLSNPPSPSKISHDPGKTSPAPASQIDPENQAPPVKPTQNESPENPTHKAHPGDPIHKDPPIDSAHKAIPAPATSPPSDSEHQKTDTSANPKHSPPKAPINDLPIGGNDPSPDNTTPPSDPELRSNIPENDKHQDDPRLGAIIFSAFGGRPKSGASSAKSFKHDAFIGASTIALPTSLSAVVTAANQLVTVVDPSAVAIGGTILSVAGNPAVLPGPIFSLGKSGKIQIGTTTMNLPNSPGVLTVQGHLITIDRQSAVVVAGSTLLPGGKPIALPNQILSLAPSDRLFLNGIPDSDLIGATESPPSVFQGGGFMVTADSSDYLVAGQTIKPGAPVTISDKTIAWAPSNDLVVGKSTIALSPPSPVFTVAGQVFTPASKGLVAGGKTLVPGGASVTISGVPISLGLSGNIVVGSSTISLPKIFAPLPSATITFDNQVFTAVPSRLALDGTTLVPGEVSVTINGVPINLNPSGKIVVGSSTTFLPNIFPNPSNPSSPITISNSVFTLLPSGLAIDGTTLTPGGPDITIAGTHLSLDPEGNLIVKNSVAITSVSSSSSSSLLEALTSGGSVFTTGSEEATGTGTGKVGSSATSTSGGVGVLGGRMRSTIFRGSFWFSAVFASILTGILW